MANEKDLKDAAVGRWIPVYDYNFYAGMSVITGYTCSQCGKRNAKAIDHCPNCDRKLRKEDGK